MKYEGYRGFTRAHKEQAARFAIQWDAGCISWNGEQSGTPGKLYQAARLVEAVAASVAESHLKNLQRPSVN